MSVFDNFAVYILILHSTKINRKIKNDTKTVWVNIIYQFLRIINLKYPKILVGFDFLVFISLLVSRSARPWLRHSIPVRIPTRLFFLLSSVLTFNDVLSTWMFINFIVWSYIFVFSRLITLLWSKDAFFSFLFTLTTLRMLIKQHWFFLRTLA